MIALTIWMAHENILNRKALFLKQSTYIYTYIYSVNITL
jgi:hypothetical protein